MTDALATWREEQLLAAGFDPPLARTVAAEQDIDLHQLLGLIDAGCPPDLALRIVAPL